MRRSRHSTQGDVNQVNAKVLKAGYAWPAAADARQSVTSARSSEAPRTEPVENTEARADSAVLFRRHASYVAGVATRLLGRDHEVDDVVQDVFLIALRGLGALREPAAARAWLTKVAVRISIRRLRWRRVRRTLGMDTGSTYEDLPDVSLSSEAQVVVARVYRLLDRLPVVDRVAWTLRQVDGQPAEAVARLCGCSLATAKRRIAKVDEAIRQELAHD
jgi:RNA polymerase sigma-70 factor (ECF subfamily)